MTSNPLLQQAQAYFAPAPITPSGKLGSNVLTGSGATVQSVTVTEPTLIDGARVFAGIEVITPGTPGELWINDAGSVDDADLSNLLLGFTLEGVMYFFAVMLQ